MAAPTLERRLGLAAAVLVGLGSMLGTGVFVVFAPAAARAGAWLPLAVAVAGLVVDYLGVAKTAMVTGILVAVTLTALTWLVLASVTWAGPAPPVDRPDVPGPWAALAAAPLLFFAFAGYARITTLGEEVREPARTIPRAVVVAPSSYASPPAPPPWVRWCRCWLGCRAPRSRWAVAATCRQGCLRCTRGGTRLGTPYS